MSHNRRTLEGTQHSVLRRQLTRLNGGTGVRIRNATPPTEFRLYSGRFVFDAIPMGSSVQLNLPQPVRDNKTVSLVALEGAGADGN